MEDFVNMIVNNGLGVACVAYMIYFQNTTMKEMLTALNQINVRLATIEHDIHGEEAHHENSTD